MGHFLQIPGPSPVPERIMQAISRSVIDHRGPEFGRLGLSVLDGCRWLFGTEASVIIYPSSGTGAWESSIVNTLSRGDRVLMVETGHFSNLWRAMAIRHGVEVDYIPGDWRTGVDASEVEAALRADTGKAIKAVMVVHNETSTGVLTNIPAVRKAIDAAGHPALLMVDAISSLGSAPFRHDEWGVDVAVTCSQKGLMLPPGLGIVAVSEKAAAAARANGTPRSYWDWSDMIASNKRGYFPYTPATNLLYGLQESIACMRAEGLDNVFERHRRLARATRAAVRYWGLDILSERPEEHSPVLTAVMVPQDHNADEVRRVALERFNISLGTGLSRVAGKVFRIGHLGACSDLTLIGALGGVEMALALADIPHTAGGLGAAMQSILADTVAAAPVLEAVSA
jgi:alanine-glyoxylate transaminase/serine-glyoxylate transaminase/serine-pyruvate transaminase